MCSDSERKSYLNMQKQPRYTVRTPELWKVKINFHSHSYISGPSSGDIRLGGERIIIVYFQVLVIKKTDILDLNRMKK